MRTLNKVLCLVLALAMMVGMCAVGASAVKLDDYPDKGSIKYQEAVALLSALGVLEGDERGFRPTDTLTRAEGAAIMTRLHNTKGAGVSSFTDMASAAWAQPYVAYCENQGIIGGMGDGTFHPQDTLTVVQFAKMLLCALGYDAGMEGLTGPAWEINTIKLINKIDLCHNMSDVDYSAPITRDQAAQMAFNMLLSTMVEYNGNVKVTTGDGTKVEVGANAEEIENAAYSYDNWQDDDGNMQFIETYFPTVKISAEKHQDDFGVVTNYWYRGETRTDEKWTEKKALANAMVGEIVNVYTTGLARISPNTIYNDAGFTENDTIWIVENGMDAYHMAIAKGNTDTTFFKNRTGATLTLVKLRPGVFVLYVKYAMLGEVTAVVPAAEAATKTRTITLKAYKSTEALNTFAPSFETEDFAKKDIVLVYPKAYLEDAKTDATEIIAVEKAEATTGTANAYSGAVNNLTGVTVDSIKYDYAATGFLGKTAGLKLNQDVTLYLRNGYIMGLKATPAATAADFVFVLGKTPLTADAFTNQSSTIGYVKQDATTATASLFNAATAYAGLDTYEWYTMAPKGATTEFKGPEGDFSQNHEDLILSSGKWSLKPSQIQITASYAANNNTVFVLKYGVGTYASYTGIKNIPTFTGDAPAPTAYVLLYKGAPAVFYIDLTGFFPQDTAAEPIMLLNATPISTREANGITYHTYSVIKDGVVTTVEAPSTVSMGEAGKLKVPAYNADGIISRLDPASSMTKIKLDGAYQTDSDVKFAGGVLTYKDGGTTKQALLADDVAFYVYNLKVNAVALISGADADYIVGKAGTLALVQVSGVNTAIKSVYFIVA